jgi:UDP-N-acetylmuramate: L-alanyl-gamma-D-glutamyl-meso-diaminopimelate ligase
VCLGPVNRPERYAPEERLDTGRLVREITAHGAVAHSLDAEYASDPGWGMHVLEFLDSQVRAGDVIAILSNGDVGGLRRMLIAE